MLSFHRMTPKDIPFGLHLCRQAGWNQTAEDWRRFLDLEPRGCFVAQWDGQPAGTTTVCVFGPIAWVAMVLVEESFRGRGIGTALVKHALDWLDERGVPTVRLDATPLGQPIYARLGFVPEYEVGRWEGIVPPCRCRRRVRPIAGPDATAVTEMDTLATGTPRGPLLRYLLYRQPTEKYLWGKPPAGYVIVRPGANAWHIGPLIAKRFQAAVALAEAAFARHVGHRVFVDIPLDHSAACAWAARAGLRLQRRWMRMVRGKPVQEVHAMLWASSGPEAG